MKWIFRRTQEDKSLAINERGLTSANWTVYNDGTKRTRYNTVPTSNITAETVTADGLTVITCRTGHHALRHITWESPRRMGGRLDKRRRSFAPQGRAGNEVPASHPTQPIATRPLAIRKDGTWYAYGWDLTKNICEVFGQHGYLRTAYTYSPYGEVTADGDVTQPIQWSSEHNDTELAFVYYNYRHYNPIDGRWIGRDLIHFADGFNSYMYCINDSVSLPDILGNSRESKEVHRVNANRRQKIGEKLNIHKSNNKEVDNMANMRPTSYIGPKMKIPATVSALDNLVQTYITFATIEVMSTMYSIIKQVPKLCKNAKSQSKDASCCETCCTIEIKAIYVIIDNHKRYIKIDSYKVLHSHLPCDRTSYMNKQDKGLCDTFRIEVPMNKLDVTLE